MNALNSAFESAPTLVASTTPSLNRSIVGIPLIPYLGAVCTFSSTLTLAIVIRPSYSFAMSSRIGESALQGPHHSAQKSTNTG